MVLCNIDSRVYLSHGANELIEWVSEDEYLGYIVSSELEWSKLLKCYHPKLDKEFL